MFVPVNKTHGHTWPTHSKTYNCWSNLKQRCNNPNNKDYKKYGGRGIKVCDRWLNSFENFLEDMGEAPEGMSIDRTNNDGNYEPNNCRWTTSETQSRNCRGSTNSLSKYKGVSKHQKIWRARIRYNKKEIYIGGFSSEIEAAKAYNNKAFELWGENAYLNKIKE